jgi:Ca2+-binding EF-hand superfamily protein
MLTDLQQRKITNLFRVHDLNQDGVLTPMDYEEYSRRIAASRGWPPGSARHNALVARFMRMWEDLDAAADRTEDKRVTLDEWMAYFDRLLGTQGLYEQVGQPIADSVFAMIDGNGDGVITADDYAMLYSAGALDPTLAADAFAKIDVDRDGRVSPAELSRLLGEFFRSNPNAPGNWLFGPF